MKLFRQSATLTYLPFLRRIHYAPHANNRSVTRHEPGRKQRECFCNDSAFQAFDIVQREINRRETAEIGVEGIDDHPLPFSSNNRIKPGTRTQTSFAIQFPTISNAEVQNVTRGYSSTVKRGDTKCKNKSMPRKACMVRRLRCKLPLRLLQRRVAQVRRANIIPVWCAGLVCFELCVYV